MQPKEHPKHLFLIALLICAGLIILSVIFYKKIKG
jgi:hypothetical protein